LKVLQEIPEGRNCGCDKHSQCNEQCIFLDHSFGCGAIPSGTPACRRFPKYALGQHIDPVKGIHEVLKCPPCLAETEAVRKAGRTYITIGYKPNGEPILGDIDTLRETMGVQFTGEGNNPLVPKNPVTPLPVHMTRTPYPDK
jgi:hypothetical protein